jgi:hypothetical protein
MENLEVDVTRHELQIAMYGYATYFAGQVELAADRIQLETEDPAVREAAIL